MYRKEDGLNYLKKYPKLNKWMNTCICCGSIGYNPCLPKKLTTNWGQGECETMAAQTLREYFQPLVVDELGICENCQKFQQNQS